MYRRAAKNEPVGTSMRRLAPCYRPLARRRDRQRPRPSRRDRQGTQAAARRDRQGTQAAARRDRQPPRPMPAAWQHGRMEDVPLTVIGVVRTGYAEREATPIQAALNRAGHGTIEIADAYAEGLDGLDGFDYAWLLTWLHRPDRPEET